MSGCWSGDPSKRPHIGELEESLREIYNKVLLSRQQAVANGDVIDIDAVYDSAATDSDVDGFDDLTLH
jgi:ABC-type Fe3+-hydroxamate transport system substrate-binding protein